jgi:hypothetical protein
MTTKQKVLIGVVLALIVFPASFLVGRVTGGSSLLGGSAYEALPKWFGNGLQAGLTQQFAVDSNGVLSTTGGLSVGSSGTTITKIIEGTCSLIVAGSYTLTASTTTAADCAVTGAAPGDMVFAQFATSTNVGSGFSISGASASTTSGYITLRVYNGTGVATLIPASVASTTHYRVSR